MAGSSYIQINLSDVINVYGEDVTNAILSTFSCPMNNDVEFFLHRKAIEFSKRGFAKTHLVFWQSEDETEKELIGYYSLAQKMFSLTKDFVSNSNYKKISQYGTYDSVSRKCIVSSILIGQLGKNYADGNDTLITGDELLKLALDKVSEIQKNSGGRYTYLECEDNPKLIKFYESNGFIQFGKRNLDPDETNIRGSYLIQLLKKI